MKTTLRLKGIGRLLVFVAATFGAYSNLSAQTTLGLQDFETSPATPTMSFVNTNGGISTGTNAASGIPASANLFVSGARGFQSNNANALVTFANVSLVGYTNNFVDFKLAGMSTNGTNGIDATDLVTVEVSLDGGTTYSSEVTIGGSAANQRWGFSAGSTTQTYDGNNAPTAVTSSTAAGISNVRLNLPNTATQARVRIRLLTNDGTERFVIDDVRIAGTASNAAPTATDVAFTGTLTAGQTLTGSYTYGDADGDLEGTSTFRWLRANDAAGTGEVAINLATATTYVLTNDDAGKYIRFAVTPVAASGTTPGTEVFSSRQGPVTASGTSLSTITADNSFVPATNVNYASFLGTTVTSSSFEIAKFNVNDVLGSPSDDGLPTILNNLTFSLSGSANIEKVALFDSLGNKIQELNSAATLNFTNLNLSAASGSSASFSVRVTFKSTVVDNAQPQLSITSATVGANSSFFATANAGGATSSIAGDNNRIEVTATTLLYIQQPTNALVGVNITPAVTLRATDGNANTDLDFTGVVTITSAAPLASAQNATASFGVATFNAISFTAAGTGYTLGANSPGLDGATSNTFDVTVQVAGVLIAEDNFDYTGGLDPRSEFVAISGAGTNAISAGAAGLSYASYGSTNIGNSVQLITSGEDIARDFTPVSSPSTIYAAFLVNISAAQATGDYFFALLPQGNTGSSYKARVSIRSASAGLVNFGLAVGTGTPTYSTTTHATGQTHLLVVKFAFTNGGTEAATLFVNPNLYAEPTSFELTSSASGSTVSDIGRYALRQGNAGNSATLTVDGVRIGTNWGAVLGNPQYDAAATINSGNYNTVSVLNGTLTAGGSVTVNNAITVNNGADFVIPNNTNLIQKGSTNNNSGNITVNRNATMKRLDYVYWGAPVTGQDLKLFSPYTVSPTNANGFPTPTGSSRFYPLNEPSNAFAVIAEPLGVNFEPAKGYMLRAPNNFPANTTAVFNGVFHGLPNNGDITIPVTASGAGMNMISNPYPSTINADSFLDANTTLETLYFWTHPTNPSSVAGANYATYNSVGAAAPSGTTPPSETPNGTIQVGQGFIAKTTSATTVTYTNDMRVNNTAGQFFRGVADEKNRIWLNLSKDDNALNQILTGYVTNATNELDPRYDAKLIENSGSKLYNLVNNDAYVIQGRALPFTNEDVVALGFKAESAGNYKIAMDHVDGIFSEGQDVFVKDQLTGLTHNIKESAYTFASEAGTFNNRFAIVYQNTTLGIDNPTADTNNVIIFKQDGKLVINSGAAEMQKVKIFDIRGRLIFERNNINATSTSVSNLNVAKQVLIVQVSVNNTIVTKKVLN